MGTVVEFSQATSLTLEDLKEIKAVFLGAMLSGYAFGKAPKLKIKELPDATMIKIDIKKESGNEYNVFDVYFGVDNSPHSFGFTKITRNGVLVWSMNYQGQYPRDKAVTGFLKEALMENYNKNIFNGGRGPRFFPTSSVVEPKFRYFNVVGPRSSFARFYGKEEITRNLGEKVGFHNYEGGMMVHVSDGVMEEAEKHL